MTDSVFHITTRASWSGAQQRGDYMCDSLINEGFIHCSRKAQLLRVANIYYSNQSGLVILEIDLAKLKPEVRWERAFDKADEYFPHIYGPINLESVVGVLDFEPGVDGLFHLPPDLVSIEP
jgi:uncharacterized protein (DUF952 family)